MHYEKFQKMITAEMAISTNAKIKRHRISQYQNEVNSNICSTSSIVSIVALLRGSPKTSVLVKFELF